MTAGPEPPAGAIEVADVEIETPEGPMRAIMARPREGDPLAAVIAYPHVGGLTGTMRSIAAIVARGGYACLVPDLYHRLGTIVIDPQSTDEQVVAIRKIAAASIGEASAMRDTDAVIAWLERKARLAPPYGTVGFGRGGSFALAAAGLRVGAVGAAASILGFGFTADGREAARRTLSRIEGEIYCAFAERDEIIPKQVPDELAGLLAELELRSQLVVHPGTRHPYVFPDRAVHDAAAAAKDWSSIFAMFERCLARHRGKSRGA